MPNKYIQFANANRDAVRAAHPNWSMVQVAKELGRMYRAENGLATPKRKSPKRKSPKRKSPKRKSPKRKSPKRKSQSGKGVMDDMKRAKRRISRKIKEKTQGMFD